MQGRSCLVVPRNLLTALWLQFAQSVVEGREFGRCKTCQAWFETSTPGTRKSRVYCSDSCKVKAHLERKLEVLQQYVKGETVREIAKAMGIHKNTVKLWVEKEK